MRFDLLTGCCAILLVAQFACKQPETAPKAAVADRVANPQPDSSGVHRLSAEADDALKRGAAREAISKYSEALALRSGSKGLQLRLAEAYAQDGQYKEALSLYEQGLSPSNKAGTSAAFDPRVWYRYGDVALKANEKEISDRAFEKVLELGEFQAATNFPIAVAPPVKQGRLALVHLVLGHEWGLEANFEQQINEYREALALAPGWELAELHLSLARQNLEGPHVVQEDFRRLEASEDPGIRAAVKLFFETPVPLPVEPKWEGIFGG